MVNMFLSANQYPWWPIQDSVGTSLLKNYKNGNGYGLL